MELDKKRILEYVEENKKVLKLIGVLLLAMLITFHIRSCQIANIKEPIQPRPVQTGVASKKDVPIQVDSFGTLSSPENVDIKAQVTGKILEVNFTQGQEVPAGHLLFTIDPQEYKAQFDEQAGHLEESVAQLKLRKDTLKRNHSLYEKQLISQQDYEQYQTDVVAAEANVQLDSAALEFARVNLEYCYIRSPIDGVTGKRMVDEGNIVSANTGPVLVNVKTIDRLFLDFTLPERDLSRVRKAMQEDTLKVRISVPGKEDDPKYGQLKLIDNTVDDSTGTFALRAIVINEDRTLWPGQFVKVRLILGMKKNAVVVPYEAAQIGKKGYYIFVVKNRKADLRMVTIGDRDDDEIVIEEGVKAGETVVTVGQLGLSPGMPVIDVTEEMKKKEKKK
ncbi:MAG: efflux RND transporter periplasmic adaptor subunit [Candidatus Omnitrophota bacterium]